MQDIENIISKNIISKIIKDNVPEVDAKLCRQFEKITTINIDDWFLKNMNKITLSYSVNYIAHYKSINEKDIKSAFYQIKNTCKKLLETILIPDRDLLKADRFDLIGNPRYKDIYKNTLSLYTAWNMIDAEHNEPTLENNSLIFVGKNFNKSTFITILSSIIETSEKLSDSFASSNNRKRDPFIDYFLLSACDIEKCGKSKVVYKYFIPRLSLFCFNIDEFVNFYKCETGNTIKLLSLYFYSCLSLHFMSENNWGRADNRLIWEKFGLILSEEFRFQREIELNKDDFFSIKDTVSEIIIQRIKDARKKIKNKKKIENDIFFTSNI